MATYRDAPAAFCQRPHTEVRQIRALFHVQDAQAWAATGHGLHTDISDLPVRDERDDAVRVTSRAWLAGLLRGVTKSTKLMT